MVVLKEFEGDSHDWDSFLATVAGAGTFYHKSHWLDNLSVTHKLHLIKLGLYDGPLLLGILPLFVKHFGMFQVASSPFYVEDTPYLGFVSEVVDINDIIDALSAYMKSHKLNFVRFVQKDSYGNLRSKKLLKYIEKHTHVLKLDMPVDDLWKNLEGRCRTAVRKAEKSGIEVMFVSDTKSIVEYYNILTDVYARQELIYPHPLEFFTGIFEKYQGENLYMLIARMDGKVVAGGIFVFDSERAYYLNGASIREFNNTGVNNMLQWHSIMHAHKLGLKYYDFVGSDQERFGNFKRSFGGVLHNHLCVEITDGYITDVVRRSYPTLKNLAMKYLKKRV